MIRLTPRRLFATICGLLGTTLVTSVLAFGASGERETLSVAVPVVAGAVEETADQSSREAVALARRGAHLGKVGVERWHQSGHKGGGVKVAILDTGFRGWK